MRFRVLSIAWAECTGWSRRPSSYGVIAGVAALIWLSASVGAEDFLARRAGYASQLTTIAAEQVKKNLPMTGATVERVLRLPRPPELGSVIARGDDVFLPGYFDFGPAGLIWGRTVVADTVQMQAGALLDVESILRVLGGLIAVLLGAQVVGTSRFSGQLEAWRALGVRPALGLTGKLVGAATVLLAGALSTIAVALAATWGRLGSEVEAAVFASSAVPIVLYLWTLSATGAASAVWSGGRVSGYVVGVSLWLVIAMIGPQFAASAGRFLAPIEPRDTFEFRRDQAFDADRRATEVELGDIVAPSLASHKGKLESGDFDDAARAHWVPVEAAWLAHVRAARGSATADEEVWQDAYLRQVRIGRMIAQVTPGSLLMRTVAGLAGTGQEYSGEWIRYAEERQRQLNVVLFDNRSQVNLRFLGQTTYHRRHDPLAWTDLPKPEPLSLPSPWSEVWPAVLVLLAYLSLAVGIAAVGAERS